MQTESDLEKISINMVRVEDRALPRHLLLLWGEPQGRSHLPQTGGRILPSLEASPQ